MLDKDDGLNKVEANPEAQNQSHRLEYEGRTGTVYKIWLTNLILRMFTLNIYTFWAKVRVRKYVASSYSLGGDHFEYTGTGGQLFKGFLKAMGIYGVLVAVYMIFSVMFGGNEIAQFVLIGGLYAIIAYLIGAAIYAAFAYRLAHTKWRGIRGRVEKGVLEYANLSFKRTIINIVTLGFKVPESDLIRHEFIMDRTHFGSAKAEFFGNVDHIFKPYLYSLIPALVSYLMIAYVTYKGFSGQIRTPEDVVTIFGAYLMPIIGLILVSLVMWLWYRAALIREKYAGMKVDNLTFQSTVTGGALFKFIFVNILLLIVTLGLAMPYIMQRKMRFAAKHTHIIGDLETSKIAQAPKGKDGFAEGLDDVLGLDTGLM